MIECLISARKQGRRGLKKAGDIIVAKLAGSDWGTQEAGAVVLIEDAVVEAELQAMLDAGEPVPVIIHPYAEHEDIPTGDGDKTRPVMVNRSQSFVSIKDMHPGRRNRLRNPSQGGRPIPAAAVTLKTRAKETRGGVARPRRTKPANRTRTED